MTWSSQAIELSKPFRIQNPERLKLSIVGGSSTYVLQTSADGGTTWRTVVSGIAANADYSFVTNPAATTPLLLSPLARVTGAAVTAIYAVQDI
jgi:hypothetical protein